jgi:hypothetical protein
MAADSPELAIDVSARCAAISWGVPGGGWEAGEGGKRREMCEGDRCLSIEDFMEVQQVRSVGHSSSPAGARSPVFPSPHINEEMPGLMQGRA